MVLNTAQLNFSWLAAHLTNHDCLPAGLTSSQQASALEVHGGSPSDEESEGFDSSDEEGEGEDDLSSSSEGEAEADGPASVRQPSGQEVVHVGGRKRRSALP